jgi:hypothetical protein
MAWDGGRWRVQATPDPVPANAPAEFGPFLEGVSCTSINACVAVGDYATNWCASAMHTVPCLTPLAERWNGVSWSLLPSPEGVLDAVSCTPDGACMAVSNGLSAGRWDGSSWSVESMPDPANVFPGSTSATILGLSCSSSSFCVAVGFFYNGPVGQTFAERWDGSSWSFQPTAQVAGAFEARLSSVSCTSPSDCVAVGDASFDRTQPFSYALAERWDGTSWSLQATPNGPGVSSELDGVSCTSSRACTAVGETAFRPGVHQPVVEGWDGTNWSLERAPGAPGSLLGAVSCTSSVNCMAVGSVAEQSAPATAKLSGIPVGCASGRFTVHLNGIGISSVAWSLDSQRLKGHTVVRGTRYVASIRLSPGRHRLRVKVRFEPSAQTRALTFRRTLLGCSPTH